MSTVTDLLSECSAAGVELFLDNGRLRYRAQSGAYTEELRQKVAAYKTELIAELASRPATLDLTREEHRQEALAAIKRGDPVLVASATLGEAVYWVRDARRAKRLKRAPDYQGEVCYTLTELRELSGQGPELLRAIHRFKKTFGATLWKANQGEPHGN